MTGDRVAYFEIIALVKQVKDATEVLLISSVGVGLALIAYIDVAAASIYRFTSHIPPPLSLLEALPLAIFLSFDFAFWMFIRPQPFDLIFAIPVFTAISALFFDTLYRIIRLQMLKRISVACVVAGILLALLFRDVQSRGICLE